MKKLQFILAVLILLVIVSCTNKEDSVNSPDTLSSPFTVKYEIIAKSAIISPGSSVIVSYINSTGQLQTESFSSLTNWNKSINVTSNVRPLTMSLSIVSSGAANGGYLAIANIGTVTQNIYINGVLKSSSTNNSASTGSSFGYKIASSPINYTVN